MKIPFLTVYETLQYKPHKNAERVNCPVLVVVAGEDTVNDPKQGITLFESVKSQEKKLYIEQEAKHYDLYDGTHFQNVINQQLIWLNEHL
ncbi:serine aminopeptidase domain-containing protein [Enterobacter cloacae]